MRGILLFLSQQAWLRPWMETSLLARRPSEHFIAGQTSAEALAVAKRVNSEGISVTLDHPGENVTSVRFQLVEPVRMIEWLAPYCQAHRSELGKHC